MTYLGVRRHKTLWSWKAAFLVCVKWLPCLPKSIHCIVCITIIMSSLCVGWWRSGAVDTVKRPQLCSIELMQYPEFTYCNIIAQSSSEGIKCLSMLSWDPIIQISSACRGKCRESELRSPHIHPKVKPPTSFNSVLMQMARNSNNLEKKIAA